MNTELDVFREHFDRYRAVTLQFLDVVTREKLTWRPDDTSFTVGEHLQHIAQTEHYYRLGLFHDRWDPGIIRLTADAHRPETLRDYFSDVRDATSEDLSRLSDAHLAGTVAVPHAPGEFPLRWWLWFMLEHEIHHKAQLAVYVRMMGLVAPFYAMPMPPGARPDIAAREQIQHGEQQGRS